MREGAERRDAVSPGNRRGLLGCDGGGGGATRDGEQRIGIGTRALVRARRRRRGDGVLSEESGRCVLRDTLVEIQEVIPIACARHENRHKSAAARDMRRDTRVLLRATRTQ